MADDRGYWTWVAVLVPTALGILGMLGWVTDSEFVRSLLAGANPMAPNTALSLVLLGVASAFRFHPKGQRWTEAIAVLPILVVASVFAGLLSGQSTLIDAWFSKPGTWFGGFPNSQMSPVVAVILLVAGASLLASRHAGVATVLAFVVALAATVLVVGYWYGVPFFYQGAIIAPTLSTSLGLLFWGVATSIAVAPESPWFAEITSDRRWARLFRKVTAILTMTQLFLGWAVAALLPGSVPVVEFTLLSVLLTDATVFVFLYLSRNQFDDRS